MCVNISPNPFSQNLFLFSKTKTYLTSHWHPVIISIALTFLSGSSNYISTIWQPPTDKLIFQKKFSHKKLIIQKGGFEGLTIPILVSILNITRLASSTNNLLCCSFSEARIIPSLHLTPTIVLFFTKQKILRIFQSFFRIFNLEYSSILGKC